METTESAFRYRFRRDRSAAGRRGEVVADRDSICCRRERRRGGCRSLDAVWTHCSAIARVWLSLIESPGSWQRSVVTLVTAGGDACEEEEEQVKRRDPRLAFPGRGVCSLVRADVLTLDSPC